MKINVFVCRLTLNTHDVGKSFIRLPLSTVLFVLYTLRIIVPEKLTGSQTSIEEKLKMALVVTFVCRENNKEGNLGVVSHCDFKINYEYFSHISSFAWIN